MVRLVACHHLVAAHAIGHGVHDWPLWSGLVEAALCSRTTRWDSVEDDEEPAPAQNMRSADSRRRLSLFFEFGGSIGDVGDLDELLPPRKSQKVRAASTATARADATPQAAAAQNCTSFSPNDVTADLSGLRRMSPDTTPKCLFVPNLRSSA